MDGEELAVYKVFALYALCTKFHCLPSQVGAEDDVVMEMFLAFMQGEGEAMKAKMPAPSAR